MLRTPVPPIVGVKHMEISLYRHPGFYGRAAELDVMIDGAKVATITGGETKRISIPGPGALLRVEMQGAVSSSDYRLTEEDKGQLFHCGPNLWVLFDIFDLAYIPALKKKVFFIRPRVTKTNFDDL